MKGELGRRLYPKKETEHLVVDGNDQQAYSLSPAPTTLKSSYCSSLVADILYRNLRLLSCHLRCVFIDIHLTASLLAVEATAVSPSLPH